VQPIRQGLSVPLTRTFLLLRSDGDGAQAAFAAELLERTRALVAELPETEVPFAALYVPDAEAHRASHPALPLGARFDAVLELEAPNAAPWQETDLPILGAYRGTERCLKGANRGSLPGIRSPGVFIVSTVRRSANLTHEAFDAHWLNEHGLLALRHHIGMCEYRQTLIEQKLLSESPSIDGIAQLGFPTPEDLEHGLFDSREGQRSIARDLERFLDLEKTETALMGRYVIRGP
jgi:hypothetical protein